MRTRDVLAGAGIAVAVLGLGFAFAPSIGADVDLSVIPVQFVGFAAVGLAIIGYVARRRTTFSRGSPPTVESLPQLGRPGAELDTALRDAGGVGLVGHNTRQELHDRLWNLALDVLVATEGCSTTEAAEMLREGTWTDDPRAVAMFGAEPPSTPLRDVFSGIISGRSQYVVQATHVISALARRMESGTRGSIGDEEMVSSDSDSAPVQQEGRP